MACRRKYKRGDILELRIMDRGKVTSLTYHIVSRCYISPIRARYDEYELVMLSNSGSFHHQEPCSRVDMRKEYPSFFSKRVWRKVA